MKLLDTNVVIEMLRKKEYEAGAISPITLMEILRGIGAEKRPKVKRLLEESFTLLSVDNKTIEAYCALYSKLREEGKLIPDADLLIAAIAIAHNLPLKTKDEHFKKLTTLGLTLAQTP
ncbi:MAG: type II toxin-antitoxin system VapC family toxin [Candidatus Nezhaarchaeales archaeon]